jgi:hypothetical protein
LFIEGTLYARSRRYRWTVVKAKRARMEAIAELLGCIIDSVWFDTAGPWGPLTTEVDSLLQDGKIPVDCGLTLDGLADMFRGFSASTSTVVAAAPGNEVSGLANSTK